MSILVSYNTVFKYLNIKICCWMFLITYTVNSIKKFQSVFLYFISLKNGSTLNLYRLCLENNTGR